MLSKQLKLNNSNSVYNLIISNKKIYNENEYSKDFIYNIHALFNTFKYNEENYSKKHKKEIREVYKVFKEICNKKGYNITYEKISTISSLSDLIKNDEDYQIYCEETK